MLRAAENAEMPIVVHSHLRWDFVWQRPQQILSRLARSHPVLFVEEPIFLDDLARSRLDLSEPNPGVHRAIPHLPAKFRDSYDDAIIEVRDLVRELIGRGGALGGTFDRPVQWFYTPMPAPAMLGALNERGVVYDCMDELSQFRFAPTDLGQREKLLLAHADVVFTGGYKLYRAKSRLHPNVHFFGCGVDVEHFSRARRDETVVPADLADAPHPVLGYFGVIDERLDYSLIAALADGVPGATVAMVGPVVKVDFNELPKRDNIRWLGQKAYAELPSYVNAFDVCLMPFALNEATEYINPTKTLEYMAAGRPIVSTAVADVVRNFVPIVRVANTPDDYVSEVRRTLAEPDDDRVQRGIQRAARSTWEAIVREMRGLMLDALVDRDSRAATRSAAEVLRHRSLAGETGAAPAA